MTVCGSRWRGSKLRFGVSEDEQLTHHVASARQV